MNIIFAIVHMNKDYKTQEYLLLASICFKGMRGK